MDLLGCASVACNDRSGFTCYDSCSRERFSLEGIRSMEAPSSSALSSSSGSSKRIRGKDDKTPNHKVSKQI